MRRRRGRGALAWLVAAATGFAGTLSVDIAIVVVALPLLGISRGASRVRGPRRAQAFRRCVRTQRSRRA